MEQSMKNLNMKDSEYGYVHAVSGPGKDFFLKSFNFLLHNSYDFSWVISNYGLVTWRLKGKFSYFIDF